MLCDYGTPLWTKRPEVQRWGPPGGSGGGGVERRDHFSVSKHNHHLLFEDILLLDE